MIRPVKVIIAGVDQFSKTFDKAGQKIASVGDKFTSVGTKLTIATAPLSAFIVKSAQVGMAYENAMNRVSKNSKLAGKDLKDFSEKLGEISKIPGNIFGRGVIAEAAADFTQAGFDAAGALEVLPTAIRAAVASSGDLQTVSKGIVETLNQFKFGPERASEAMDKMVKATLVTKTNVGDMLEGMKNAAAPAASLGLKYHETLGMLAALQQGGITPSMSGTYSKIILTRLASQTGDAAEVMEQAFEQFGIRTRDLEGNMRNPMKILRELQAAMDSRNMGTAARGTLLDKVFGKDAIAAVMTLMSELEDSEKSWESISAKIKDSFETNLQASDIMAQGVQNKLAGMKIAWENLLIKFYESSLAERLGTLFERVTRLLDKLEQVPKPIMDMAFNFSILAIAIGPILFGVGQFIVVFGHLATLVQTFMSAGFFRNMLAGFMKLNTLGAGKALLSVAGRVTPFAIIAGFVVKILEAVFRINAGLKAWDEDGNLRSIQTMVEALKEGWDYVAESIRTALGLKQEFLGQEVTANLSPEEKKRRAAYNDMMGAIAHAKGRQAWRAAGNAARNLIMANPIISSSAAVSSAGLWTARQFIQGNGDGGPSSYARDMAAMGIGKRDSVGGEVRITIDSEGRVSDVQDVTSGPIKFNAWSDRGSLMRQ